MAGSVKTTGLKELEEKLGKLGAAAPKIASAALYEGAGIVANAYSEAVDSIVTGVRRFHKEPGGRLPTPEEKAALKSGIARFNKEGSEVNTLVGIAEGYADVRGNKKAIKLLARSINSGTSFMQKQPVFRKAASKCRKAATEAMVRKADELIEEIMLH